MVQTKVYVPLQSKGNAINAINEIADKMSLSNISLVVYDLAENHLVAASDDPHLCGGSSWSRGEVQAFIRHSFSDSS